MPRIAFGGKKGTGKSTAAITLAWHLSAPPDRVLSFATPLYGMINVLERSLGVQESHPQGAKDRDALRALADYFRSRDPDTFVRVMKIQIGLSPPGTLLVDDVRYRNEFVALKEAGFKMVYMKRDGVDDGDAHSSEQTNVPAGEWDVVIENNGGPMDLRGKLLALLE